MRYPSRPDKYKLTKCLNCGAVLPCMLRNLKLYPPKRCVFCSNIGNHSHIKTNTNNWALYEDYAVCNISYKNEIVSAYIDVEDYDIAKNYVWRISQKKQKYYVASGSFKKQTGIYLHALVLGGNIDGYEIDHIDGNSLNNRKANLRYITHQENVDNTRATRIDNTIGIRGIVFDKRSNTYKSDFSHHGKRFYTKHWHSIEEAVWCRYCFEKHFNLPMIENNPIASNYMDLSEKTKTSINKYVEEVILRNER